MQIKLMKLASLIGQPKKKSNIFKDNGINEMTKQFT